MEEMEQFYKAVKNSGVYIKEAEEALKELKERIEKTAEDLYALEKAASLNEREPDCEKDCVLSNVYVFQNLKKTGKVQTKPVQNRRQKVYCIRNAC